MVGPGPVADEPVEEGGGLGDAGADGRGRRTLVALPDLELDALPLLAVAEVPLIPDDR